MSFNLQDPSTSSYFVISFVSFATIYFVAYFNQSFLFVFLMTAAYGLYSMKRDEKRTRIEALKNLSTLKSVARIKDFFPDMYKIVDAMKEMKISPKPETPITKEEKIRVMLKRGNFRLVDSHNKSNEQRIQSWNLFFRNPRKLQKIKQDPCCHLIFDSDLQRARHQI